MDNPITEAEYFGKLVRELTKELDEPTHQILLDLLNARLDAYRSLRAAAVPDLDARVRAADAWDTTS